MNAVPFSWGIPKLSVEASTCTELQTCVLTGDDHFTRWSLHLHFLVCSHSLLHPGSQTPRSLGVSENVLILYCQEHLTCVRICCTQGHWMSVLMWCTDLYLCPKKKKKMSEIFSVAFKLLFTPRSGICSLYCPTYHSPAVYPEFGWGR